MPHTVTRVYTMQPARHRIRHGFTLLEVLFVLVVSAIMMTAVVNGFARYTRERSAQQAAYLLSRDLRLARASAIGSRQPISLVVDPGARSYVIRDTLGNEIARRTFAAGSELMIESISLGQPGDKQTRRGDILRLQGFGHDLRRCRRRPFERPHAPSPLGP